MSRLLDDGLDELAARGRAGYALRMPVTVAAAALVSQLLPWTLCLVWCVAIVVCETISWHVGAPPARGERASAPRRLAYLATLVVGSSIWTGLGMVLWTSGAPANAVAAMVIWLAVIFFAQTNAYQSPTGFLVGGAAPGLFIIGFLSLGPDPLSLPRIPLAGLTLLALGFACDGMFRALSARRQFDQAQARLAESEAQYRVLADNITDVIALNRIDTGARVYVSPSVEQALGYTPEEMFAGAYDFLHPDDVDDVAAGLSALMATRTGATLQYRMLHKDGRAVWMETHYGVVAGQGDGATPFLLGVSRNIDARKALETDLIEARQRAEAAAAAKSDFLANMTHELRTPLNAIIGFSGVLKDSPRLVGEDVRHAGLIHEASATLLELVNSVLDFSRLEAGAVELEAQVFDPLDPVRAMIRLLADQAEAKGLSLSLHQTGPIARQVGDAARIRQVLLNLLSNGLKFTAQGGVAVTLSQTAAAAGRAVLRVEVADTGIGVAPDQLDHLFDRFTQADASVSRQYGGTGLGLAICDRTIALMGGRIGCVSQQDQGSTFWFELDLPLAEADHPQIEDAEAQGLAHPLRLLLVEDVAVNRELIAAVLSPFDVTIDIAENGREAVERMSCERFDLVLMDVQMPVMDGLTATRLIRALDQADAASTPIIAMTANVLPDQVRKCLDAGMDDHLGKPISPQALFQALARWSDGRDPAPGAAHGACA